MEYPKAGILAFVPMRFAFNLNLPDERGDGLDGVRHGEESDQRQARVRQTRVNTLADRPDLSFAGQSCEDLDRIIGHHVVKLPNQSLIGPENDRAYRTRSGRYFQLRHRRRRLVFPKARTQTQLHGPIIVGQCAHRFLVLSDARCGQGFHRADNGLKISGTADFSAQALRGVAHDFFLASAAAPGASAWARHQARPWISIPTPAWTWVWPWTRIQTLLGLGF